MCNRPDNAALNAAVDSARYLAELLLALAASTWKSAGHSDPCPADKIPSLPDLIEWLPRCPRDAMADSSERLTRTMRTLGESSNPEPYRYIFNRWEWRTEGPALFLECRIRRGNREPGPYDGRLTWPVEFAVDMWREWFPPSAIDQAGNVVDPKEGEEIRPSHPLAPLVREWQKRPVQARTETRRDTRIIPATWRVDPARNRGMLIGGVAQRAEPANLPLFPELEPKRLEVPLLDLVDGARKPIRTPARSRGAPLPARLLVSAILAVERENRQKRNVWIAVSFDELIQAIWPGHHRPAHKRRNLWPRLREALKKSREYSMRVPSVTSSGEPKRSYWFPMALRRLPDDSDGLPRPDDLIEIDLSLPEGAAAGPIVQYPYLAQQGLKSGPKWAAYIAARTLAWQPGTSRVPTGAPERWGWSRIPDKYPVVTLDDLRRFAFGTGDQKNRTRDQIIEPYRDLPDMKLLADQSDPRTGIKGVRIMPTKPHGEGDPESD